ncbi:MAG: citrate synthase 3 [SAR202 cluster bacterium Casp-Chloro-G4]|nr:citrate synthase [Chloroflexota bacterium]MDA1228256.1 citrate synthase [Chloroflexota bacterium]PKB61359.1 MAG: citrate synthase 3 [SAR202 cluster bacterium Casp-Chloro-G4]
MTSQSYSPGLNGIIAAEIGVSLLDTDLEQIIVRGYDLIELAQNLNYTDVAYLVIYGQLPTEEQGRQFCQTLAEQSEIPEDLYRLFELMPKSTVAMDALRTGISFLAGYEAPELLHDNSREANLKKGLKLLAQVPAITVNSYRALNNMPFVRPDPSLGYMENFMYMLRGEKPDPVSLDVFDRIHTCYIEHEMPNSTFTARVIASTLADMYCAMVGSVASLKGPLHGGANEAAIEFILDIQKEGGRPRAEAYVMEKLAANAKIMGFGHRVYMKKYDPRAKFLMEYIPKLASRIPDGEELTSIYNTVEKVMFREKALYPNTDFPIGLLYYELGIPVPLYTPIFLASRTAGNIAHVVEQHENNSLFRPRVIYNGARGLHPPSSPISPG